MYIYLYTDLVAQGLKTHLKTRSIDTLHYKGWMCHVEIHGSVRVKPEFTSACNIHPLQPVNCFRNSRFVVDEDDFKWMTSEQMILSLLKQLHENFVLIF